jgi:uncharacterized protein (DUF2336 family)
MTQGGRLGMAADPVGLNRDQVLKILEERAQAVQNELAGQTDAGDQVLSYLARNGAVATRRAVAANRAAPATVNRLLADDDDDDVRAELARKIARLMPGLSSVASERIRTLTVATLERLAADQVPRVRAILAEEIKTLDCVPARVVRALARDLEAAVRVPILEYSPLLSDADLLEIIAGGEVHDVLTAIARRRPVSANVADAIVSSLDVTAVSALLTNPDAGIREKTLERIAEQAEKIEAWQTPMVLRADLSQRVIKRLASFVGAALIEMLAARHGLDEETRSHLNRQLRTRLDENGQAQSDALDAAAREVEAAAAAGRLDDGFVEAAAEAGRRESVVLALCALGHLPEDKVRRVLAARSAKPIVALVWRCKLGMRAAFKIQRFVMKLPANELLPARDGVRFPLSEDEMKWHLGYFDVPV